MAYSDKNRPRWGCLALAAAGFVLMLYIYILLNYPRLE